MRLLFDVVSVITLIIHSYSGSHKFLIKFEQTQSPMKNLLFLFLPLFILEQKYQLYQNFWRNAMIQDQGHSSPSWLSLEPCLSTLESVYMRAQ